MRVREKELLSRKFLVIRYSYNNVYVYPVKDQRLSIITVTFAVHVGQEPFIIILCNCNK